jgi:hypothetical protein
MKFDWKTMLVKLAALTPYIVGGVEQLHSEASSADKKQIAQDSLLMVTGIADAVLPDEQKAIADSVSSETGNMIESFVRIFNATGIFQHKPPALKTAAAPAPLS